MTGEALKLPGFGSQVPSWRAPDRPVKDGASTNEPARANDGLRPYQAEAVARISAELDGNASTLLVMATGTGKTQTFGGVAKHWPGRVLVLAHRDELIQQAQSRLEQMTGELIDIEQAEWRAAGSRIVVASVQTLCRPARLERFPADAFSLIIVDEAHHAVAATYRKILAHFKAAKVLGVTATPDRADERAMGQVFDSVAYVYDIQDGIRDRYLCLIRVRTVEVESIDLSGVGTVAGDLNQGELDAVMAVEETLHGIAQPTIEHAGDRRTIVFTTSVSNAHRLAEVINRYKPGSARAVDGGTNTDMRRQILRDHKEGRYQYLCNVGVLTEGYDDPGVACVAMARPTKSRALYAQCAGRGLRILAGKADCLLLDFVGNSGRHALVNALDILAGKHDDEVVARAKKKAAETPGMLADEALAEAAKDIAAEKEAARRKAIKAKVKHRIREVDPFAVLGVDNPAGEEWAERYQTAPDAGQLAEMDRMRIDIPAGCTKAQASRLIGAEKARRRAGLATYRMCRFLSKYGIPAAHMQFATAGALCGAIEANGWRKPAPEVIARIINAGREPGEDG